MGLLKKIFKPVSKVLDKIIPNEIKPLLPYAAAFAPYAMPGIMGIGGNTMLSRALMSGGLNIGAQLAQEGSEGDINLLSAGLGALQGAMTAPDAASKFQAMKFGQVPGVTEGAGLTADFVPAVTGSTTTIPKDIGMFQKAANYGLEGLAKGSEFIEKMQGSDKLVDKLKLYTAPATLATGDLMYAQGQRDLKDLANEVVDEMGGGYTDAAYRAAIRKSMTAYGATEEEILAAIEAAGYKAGGRVGFEMGGLGALGGAMEKEPEWETVKRTLNEIFQEAGGLEGDGMNAVNQYVRDNNLNYEWLLQGDEIKVKEKENMNEPVNILNSMDGIKTITVGDDIELIMPTKKAKGGRVGFEFGGIGEAVEKVEDKQMKETLKLAQDMDMPIEDLLEEFMIIHKRKPNSLEELKMFYRDKYKWKGPADVKMQETMTERFTAKDGGTPSVLPPGIEADYRGGGFIPIGSRERADDVPARLSENEFVMTADAVRAAGGGSVNRGAKRMYDLMHNLEARA